MEPVVDPCSRPVSTGVVAGASPNGCRQRPRCGSRAVLPAAAAGLLLALGVTRAAAAASEEEWQLGAQVGGSVMRADGRTPAGALVGVDAQYGFAPGWAARGGLDLSFHPVDEETPRPGGVARAVSAAAGLTYALDVLRVVPFAELGASVILVGGDVAARQQNFGLQIGLGVDYLLDRRWSLGLVARHRQHPLRLGGEDAGFGRRDPLLFSIGVRLSRIFF